MCNEIEGRTPVVRGAFQRAGLSAATQAGILGEIMPYMHPDAMAGVIKELESRGYGIALTRSISGRSDADGPDKPSPA